MKQKYLILIALTLFASTLWMALVQGQSTFAPLRFTMRLEAFQAYTLAGFPLRVGSAFAWILNSMMGILGGSLLVSAVVLALGVELALLYPSLRLQMKQKKMRLFHKKLLRRFESGELALSQGRQELGVLEAVNERLHWQGACLVLIQITLFFGTLWGLRSFVTLSAPLSLSSASLLFAPLSPFMPLLTALAYFFYALVRIHLRQREDEIEPLRNALALGIAFLFSALVFFASGLLPALLSVYFVALVTFGTLRYLWAEYRAIALGTQVRHLLIQMIQQTKVHPSFLRQRLARWRHQPFWRHLNFHLLEEAASMSLVLLLVADRF